MTDKFDPFLEHTLQIIVRKKEFKQCLVGKISSFKGSCCPPAYPVFLIVDSSPVKRRAEAEDNAGQSTFSPSLMAMVCG